MQLLSALAVTAAVCASAALAAPETHVHLRVHQLHKFYVTPIGHQCAYNNCVDPSVYPCAHGACVRLNYTYGICRNDTESMATEQDYNDPSLLCPYPNPYNSQLGSLADSDDNTDSTEEEEEEEEYDVDEDEDESWESEDEDEN